MGDLAVGEIGGNATSSFDLWCCWVSATNKFSLLETCSKNCGLLPEVAFGGCVLVVLDVKSRVGALDGFLLAEDCC